MDSKPSSSVPYTAVPIDEKYEEYNGAGKKERIKLKDIKKKKASLIRKEELILETDNFLNRNQFESDSSIDRINKRKDELLKGWEDYLYNQECYCYMLGKEEIKKGILDLVLKRKLNIIEGLLDSIAEINDEEFLRYLEEIQEAVEKKELTEEIFKGLWFHEYTLLQATCKHGMIESVRRLLALGFDINEAEIIPHKPIQLACKYGQPEILQLLIDKKVEINDKLLSIKNDRNLLHLTVRSLAPFERSHKCLKILLKQTDNGKPQINVNNKDKIGRTPLHYAVMHKNEPCVLKLLKNGARIDEKDHLKQSPLSSMTEDAFRKYLDSMVSFKTYVKGKKDRDDRKDYDARKDYDLEFNFKNLFRENHYFKMDMLKKIKRESRLKKLIAHPIISIIIYFQWYRIRLCFYFYIIFYMIFTALFTAYTILDLKPQNGTDLINSTEVSLNLTECGYEESSSQCILFTLSAIIISIFTLLEIMKITGVSWPLFRYVKSLDNVIRCITIVLTWAVIVVNGVSNSEFIRLKAITILFVWFELFLVFAKYPPLTYHIITFRSASIRLLKFLVVHSILLYGFAFAFHVLFRKSKAEIFHNPAKAIFKTVIMLTSEFDANDIPFNDYPYSGVSHIIFVFYIFVVTIVLFNLMIALALSKVNDMEKNPLLYRSFTEIDMIVHFEQYYLESQNALHTQIQKLIFSVSSFLFRVFLWVTCQNLQSYTELNNQIITMKENKMQQFIIFKTYPERNIHFVKTEDYINSRIFPKIYSWLFKNELDHKIVNNAWEIATRRLTEKQSKINQLYRISSHEN